MLTVLLESINNTENMAVGFYLVSCDNMHIFDIFRPFAIFYYIE